MAAEDVIADAKNRLEALIAPIHGGAGADVSYDEAFELMKGEVDKLQSLTGGKVDWPSVAASAEEILTSKGKDFRVAIYYAAARSLTSGLPGLLDAYVLLDALIEGYWESMGPPLKRPKARANLSAWFSDIAAPAFSACQPTAKDADLVSAIDQVSRAVDMTLADRLGESYVGMTALRTVIRSISQAVPRPAPPPPPPPQPPPLPLPQPQPQPQPPPDQSDTTSTGGLSADAIADADAATAAIPVCSQILCRIGELLRGADPTDASAYRAYRMGLWLEIQKTPPAEDGVTLIEAPPADARAPLEARLAAEDWTGLIEAADAFAVDYPLWLDLQRYVATGLARLGAEDARRSLLGEVASLLLRAEGLGSLLFKDGTPIADDETRAWIEGEVQKGPRGGAVHGAPRAAASPLDQPIEEARALADNGQLPEAVARISKALGAAAKPVDRFRGRLEIAKLCLGGGQAAIACAQLDGLERLAERHHLDEWEPALSAELYAALYTAYRVMSQVEELTPEGRARLRSAFERLCQLDAEAALRVGAG
jgi:type VI secretion system protein VasJ